MEPEGSYTHSQEPATCPYSEPDESSSCPIPLTEGIVSVIKLQFPTYIFFILYSMVMALSGRNM
jgi:hypothetical protein